jgi:hypothetical protein
MDAFESDWTAYVTASREGRTALSTSHRDLPLSFLSPSASSSASSTPPPVEDLPFATRDLGSIPPHPNLGTAERAREVFEKEGWLPPVQGPHEEERLRVLRRFGLQDLGQVEAVDKIAESAQMVRFVFSSFFSRVDGEEGD